MKRSDKIMQPSGSGKCRLSVDGSDVSRENSYGFVLEHHVLAPLHIPIVITAQLPRLGLGGLGKLLI